VPAVARDEIHGVSRRSLTARLDLRATVDKPIDHPDRTVGQLQPSRSVGPSSIAGSRRERQDWLRRVSVSLESRSGHGRACLNRPVVRNRDLVEGQCSSTAIDSEPARATDLRSSAACRFASAVKSSLSAGARRHRRDRRRSRRRGRSPGRDAAVPATTDREKRRLSRVNRVVAVTPRGDRARHVDDTQPPRHSRGP
jgi:hypothetical protein